MPLASCSTPFAAPPFSVFLRCDNVAGDFLIAQRSENSSRVCEYRIAGARERDEGRLPERVHDAEETYERGDKLR